jgi:hypothetical protein
MIGMSSLLLLSFRTGVGIVVAALGVAVCFGVGLYPNAVRVLESLILGPPLPLCTLTPVSTMVLVSETEAKGKKFRFCTSGAFGLRFRCLSSMMKKREIMNSTTKPATTPAMRAWVLTRLVEGVRGLVAPRRVPLVEGIGDNVDENENGADDSIGGDALERVGIVGIGIGTYRKVREICHRI